MKLTRRAFAGGMAAATLAASARASDDALSAAVLAITLSQPKSLDGLRLTGEDGPVMLTAFRGRLVILNFWATWCLPCRREMPSLSRLATAMAGRPCSILPLAMDRGGLARVAAFYDETGISNLPLLAGDAANLQEVVANTGLPSTCLIDSAGMMRWSVTGEARWDDADTIKWITSLLPA